MRRTTGSAAALAARCSNVRRGSFIASPFREILECGNRGSPQTGRQFDFFECKPADGMSAAAEKNGFRHVPLGSSTVRLHRWPTERKGMTACATFRKNYATQTKSGLRG